ncbi:tail fiber protein [Pelagibacter phage HTVC134P]|nr:tail fiber protein [Pelagibacter phage HTVC134P]
MANSFVRYTGNGSTTAYAISYTYRDAADLIVSINGVATTSYTLNSAGTTLTFDSAPANASAIEIRRKTSQTTRLTDYAAGSVLTENDLDTDSNQAFFMGQEAIDDANDVIKISSTDFQYDATNKQIRNVANPTSAQDVATKDYLENTFLTSANKTALTTVNANIANINAVNSNSSNINSAVSNATNINTVATNIGSVNTVATDITKVIAVANDLAEAVSEVETVADDLNEATSEIDTVATSITNVDAVGTNIANVNTVAGINSDVSTVAGISSDITTVRGINLAITNVSGISNDVASVNSNSSNINTVAGNNTNVSTVAGISGNVTTVAGISSDVTSVANDATDIGTVAGISSDVTSVAGISSVVSAVNSNSSNINAVNSNSANINTVAGNNTNINTVAGVSSDVTTVAGISSDVQAVENIASNVTTVAGMSTAINTANSNSSNINTVAGAITNVNNVGGSIANVNTVATNLASVNAFGETYRIASSAPTTSLNSGDLYFNTSTNVLNVYGASGWQNAGSSVNGTSQRYNYTATNAQTTFTGADNGGNTLAYDAGFIDVYLNGVKLLNGTDVTVTSGSSVVLASGATTGDVVDIVAYGTFSVASLNADNLDSGTVPSARLGTITNFTSTGIDDNATSTAITIDSSERVGIGTTSPTSLLAVEGTSVVATFKSTNNNNAVRIKGNNATNGVAIGSTSSDDFVFTTNVSERMRIDSSGNLLVGKTASNTATAGIELRASNLTTLTRSGNNVLTVNRLSNDGSLINLTKNSSTVGTISARFGGVQIGSSDTGLLFNNSTKEINPTNADGGINDNLTILGANNRRFKDLYLGGGLYVGGTGTANKLDDYEEGTWTPTVNTASGFSTGATNYSGTSAPRYTKIGNRVFLQCQVQMGNSSGNVALDDSITMTGIPFTPADIERNTVTEYRYNNNVAYMTSFLQASGAIFSVVRFLKGTPLRNGGAINININYSV